MITPLPRLPQHRREWLTEASTCRYEDLQVLLAAHDAVPLLWAALMDAQHDLANLLAAARSGRPLLLCPECGMPESIPCECGCDDCGAPPMECECHLREPEPDSLRTLGLRESDFLPLEDVRRIR
jgi:hypothetical protein